MKHILKPLLIICLYELSKAIIYEIIVRKQANDMVDVPKDYEERFEEIAERLKDKHAMVKAYKIGRF